MNANVKLVASGTYTAAPTIADVSSYKERGVEVIIDITSLNGGTGSIIATIKGKDPVSGKYYTILASASLGSVATTILRVYPGLTASTNLTVNDVLPLTWTVVMTHADTQQITYSVAANVLI